MRGIRVTLHSGNLTTPLYFQSNDTTWNSSTGDGSYIISDYDFKVDVGYNWTLAVMYDSGAETIWSQESSVVTTKISGR